MTAVLTKEEIDNFLAEAMARPASAESRRWNREKFDGPIVLSAIDAETGQPFGKPIVAEGRDISSGGVRYVHDDPVPGVRMMAVIRDDKRQIRKLLLAHIRTTVLDDGRLESAGRFVQPQSSLRPGKPRRR